MRRMVMILAILVLAAMAGPNPLPMSDHCSGALRVQALEAAGLSAEQKQQEEIPPMPPPGNPGHQTPHDKAFCDRSKNPARNCACHAKCVYDIKGKLVDIEEDGANCRANCFKKHCHCDADCE